MFEYIEFYTKNISNLTILLVIGAVIAILDITLRNVVKGVYLNVRENIRLRHSSLDEIEGMENKKKKNTKTNTKKQSGGGEAEAGVGDENCPKDCNEVLALQKKLAEAETAELRAKADYNKAVAKCQQQTGTTLRVRGVKVE